jgi:hypothetical protein
VYCGAFRSSVRGFSPSNHRYRFPVRNLSSRTCHAGCLPHIRKRRQCVGYPTVKHVKEPTRCPDLLGGIPRQRPVPLAPRSAGRVRDTDTPIALTLILPPNGALSRLRRYRFGNCTFVTNQAEGNHFAPGPTVDAPPPSGGRESRTCGFTRPIDTATLSLPGCTTALRARDPPRRNPRL